jgi:hypothetical protein
MVMNVVRSIVFIGRTALQGSRLLRRGDGMILIC